MTSTSSSSSSWIVCTQDNNSDPVKEGDLVDISSEEIDTSNNHDDNVDNLKVQDTQLKLDTENIEENQTNSEKSCQTELVENNQEEREKLLELVRKKHQESLQYHAALQSALKLQESDNEKIAKLEAEIERLRNRLIEIEQIHSGELIELSEQRDSLEENLSEIKKKFDTFQTSTNIINNQQIETLTRQLELTEAHRDELIDKSNKDNDKIMKQNARLINLQCVLEQFQKDKALELELEKKKFNEQHQIEANKRIRLESENERLVKQIDEFKLGLNAASRLTDQVEVYKKQLEQSKFETEILRKDIENMQLTLNAYQKSNETKIEKSLIRNLIVNLFSSQVGLLSSLTNDQRQIFKVIAAVLDFTQDDKEKLDLIRWDKSSDEVSLSNAFIRFLENESKNEIKISTSAEDKQKIITKIRQERSQTQLKLPTLNDFYTRQDTNTILKNVLNQKSGNC